MFYRLKSLFNRMISTSSYSSDLELYIMSKKPKSVVEMEYLVKEYDRKRQSYIF